MTRVTVLLKTNQGGLWVLPQIRALEAAGAMVTVIIPGGPGALRRSLDEHGIRVVESPFDFRFGLRPRTVLGLLRLRRTIERTQPDVLFYHLYASALAARISSLGMPARRVHMVAGPLYLASPLVARVERLLCRLDHRLVAGSAFTADAYRALGYPESRLTTAAYGVDTTAYRPGPDERGPLLGLPATAFVAIMVAYTYAPKRSVFPGVGVKGHEVLLAAWARFAAGRDDVALVLVGSGFDAEGEAHRLRLQNNPAYAADATIRWVESTPDVGAYYRSADVSVSPSLSDNHGAVLEASAMGLPSIVSDAGALPETVDGTSGIVVAAGDVDALAAALAVAYEQARTGELAERGRAARAYVERTFDHRVTLPTVVRAVLGTPEGVVAATCEQRTHTAGGRSLGLKTLPLVERLGAFDHVSVRLLSRDAPRPDGARLDLAPSSRAAPVRWPRRWWDAPVLASAGLRVLRVVDHADVVQVDTPGVLGGLATLAAVVRRRPLVVNVVGDARESLAPAVMPGRRAALARTILVRLQLLACRRAVLANYVTSQVLQTRYPSPRARMRFSSATAVPLGPSRPRPFPDVGRPLALVTVASMEQNYKGIDDLLLAVHASRLAERSVRLTVVGEGRLRPHYEHRANELGLGVTFTGHLVGEDLYEELGRHDAFVLASWTEGMPRALVEAMGDGMPAVATRVGGVPDLLETHRLVAPHCPAGLAVAIGELFSDRVAWDRSVAHGIRTANAVIDRSERDGHAFTSAVAELARQGAAARG